MLAWQQELKHVDGTYKLNSVLNHGDHGNRIVRY